MILNYNMTYTLDRPVETTLTMEGFRVILFLVKSDISEKSGERNNVK